MARTLGKYCIVQNCSDQFDYRGLGKTYKGLAISGCWGCFDEWVTTDAVFLLIEHLIIFLDSIESICRYSLSLHSRFNVCCKRNANDGKNSRSPMEIKWHSTTHLPSSSPWILAMPVDRSYPKISRSIFVALVCEYSLDGTKKPSISLAMMVPDRQIIMRVKLASGGFLENTNLAQKFFTLYKCCEDQLSKQVHYDYGLRNITAVLRTLGTVKRTRAKDPEETIVMRVLRDMNLSKLVHGEEVLDQSETVSLSDWRRWTFVSLVVGRSLSRHQVRQGEIWWSPGSHSSASRWRRSD